MSFDLKFQAICDHRTHLEPHSVDKDRRTVYLPYPVFKVGFHVYLNGYEVKATDPKFGWLLTTDPNGATPDFLKMLFKHELHVYDDVVQLSYQTAQSYCRRCHGKRFYMDLVSDSRGQLRLVSDEEKLIQDLRKGVLTVRGTNTYASWYGTALVTLIGTKVGNVTVIQLRLQREVSLLLDNLMKMQLRQAEVQRCSLRELIMQVLGLDVAQADTAGSQWEITVRVANRAGDEVSFTEKLDLYRTQALGDILNRQAIGTYGKV